MWKDLVGVFGIILFFDESLDQGVGDELMKVGEVMVLGNVENIKWKVLRWMDVGFDGGRGVEVSFEGFLVFQFVCMVEYFLNWGWEEGAL